MSDRIHPRCTGCEREYLPDEEDRGLCPACERENEMLRSPGRWFSWNFRTWPPEPGGERPSTPRVLAWKLSAKRWDVVKVEDMEPDDYWLHLPGNPERAAYLTCGRCGRELTSLICPVCDRDE